MGEENSGGPILPKLQALLRSLGEMDKARHIGEIWTILQRIQAEDKPDFAIMAMLKELEYNKNGSMKQKNVQLLVMALIRIASLYDSILSFVEAMLALRTKRKWDEHNADKHPVVTLSTMHSAKGQEYDHVIIIDAVEDLMRETAANRCLSGMPPGKLMWKKNADFSMWQPLVPGMICESW